MRSLTLRLAALLVVGLVPLTAWAGPQDTRVGETRVLYAATGTTLKAEPAAAGAQVAVLPANTRVQVLEVNLPWVKVRGAAPGQPPVEGWIRAYQATEPGNLASTPPPAHVDDRKAAQVTQQQVNAAGRQFTADTEQRYQTQNPSLASSYEKVNALERASASMQGGDAIEFTMDGSIGRRGCDYVLPQRLPPVVTQVQPKAGGKRGGGLGGLLGGVGKELIGKAAGDLAGKITDNDLAKAAIEFGVKFASEQVLAQTAQLKKEFNHDQEYYLGRAVAAQAIARYGVEPDENLRRYVRRVGDAMVRVSSRVQPNYGGYHFEVLNSDEVNGISGPGGFVLITRGAVKACRTEDELAGVLAHELAHITRKHAEQVMRQGQKWQSGMGGFAKAVAGAAGVEDETFKSGLSNLFTEAVGEMNRVSSAHAYGPALEYDADREGTHLLYDVFYRWTALRDLLLVLGHTEQAHGGATHAEPEQRAAMLEQVLAPLGPPPERPGVDHERLVRFNAALGRPAPPAPPEQPR
jgi:beta-barrel assembly-enhancing protease